MRERPAGETQLLDRLRAARPAIADDTFEAVQREVASYPRLSARGREDVRCHIVDQLEASHQFMATGSTDLEFVHRLALRTARAGYDRDEILACYRVGPRVQAEWIARNSGQASEALRAGLALTVSLMEYAHRASSLFSEEYQRERRRLQAERTAPQRELLEDLLAGMLGPAVETRARRFGLRPDAAHCVAVVRARNLSRTESAIAQHLRMVHVPALAVTRQEELVIVAGDSAPLRHVLEREAELTQLSAGISLPARGLGELPRAHAQAHQALAVAPAGRVTGLADLSLFEYLVARADDTAPLLVPAGLARLDAVHRQTLLTFADCDLNAGLAASRLGVHSNTVHYRLQRIEKLTGRDVRRFRDLVELVTGMLLLERSG